MKLDTIDFDDFIAVRNSPLVDNAIYFNMNNSPTDDGLFSNRLFGFPGSKERKTIFGYIDLKKHYLHPVFYNLFISMGNRYSNILSGKKYYRLENNDIIEDPENGKTGISYFYEIFDKLKFKDTETMQRSMYLDLLTNSKKDNIFITKFLVIPPYLRDYNSSDSSNKDISAVDEVNSYYAKLIRLTTNTDSSNSLDFIGASTEASIQQILADIYNYFITKISGKTGMIHQALLGKSIDYATGSVIAAPQFKARKWQNSMIRFGYIGVPLTQLLSLFMPLFIKYIRDYIEEREDELSHVIDKHGNEIIIKDIREQFSTHNIQKLMKLYINTVTARFDPLTVKDSNGNEYPVNLYKKDLNRLFTLTDLFYIAAVDVCIDKHVYITRYPVENILNIFPCRIKILSTIETKEQVLQDRYLPDYPVIYEDYPCTEEMFNDTVTPHNTYLKALGADFDGDTVSVRGIFSKEANIEAEEIIKSVKYILDQEGKCIREVGNECIQSIYSLTK